MRARLPCPVRPFDAVPPYVVEQCKLVFGEGQGHGDRSDVRISAPIQLPIGGSVAAGAGNGSFLDAHNCFWLG
jgi:hypothetical protein